MNFRGPRLETRILLMKRTLASRQLPNAATTFKTSIELELLEAVRCYYSSSAGTRAFGQSSGQLGLGFLTGRSLQSSGGDAN